MTFADWAKGQMEYLMGDNEIAYLESVNTEGGGTVDDEARANAPKGPRCFIVGIQSDGIFLLHCLAYIHITKGFKALHFALLS